MKTLMMAGALALALLSPALALAQGIAPSLDCHTDVRGERTCRTVWPDIRYQAKPSEEQSTPKEAVTHRRKQHVQ